MARAREVPELSCEQPYGHAAARVLAVRADELIEHSAGVLDTGEIEHLHDMRVASRRLRAAMEIFEPCFPRKQFRAALKEVKAVADALGERRDRDVSIAALEDFAAKLSAADRQGISVLVKSAREEQAVANRELAPFITEQRLEGLRKRLDRLAHAAQESAS
jgi:CHAD domain-containing protein